MTTNFPLLTCVVCGTLFSIVPNITSADVIKTVSLAVLGAIVSFIVSLLLKHTIRKQRKEQKNY
ncbi:hypothetical protein ABGT15_06880 [Flavobacterium enshiense]|uniref:hypothetical protein n=1 Tax=Flavobacterium enshiense TaxID=1341165 RepID=UPI00345C86FC